MIVQTKNLTKRFGDFVALDDVNLEIRAGEMFGLLGPNGAGKSTLIRTLLGFLSPTSGMATIAGLDCVRDRVAIHSQTAYLPGDARMYSLMRATKALRLHCNFRESSSFEKALAIAKRLDLDLNRWVGLMSTGMRQKLALAATLANDVSLLILDEPTANLDPTVRSEVLLLAQEAQAAGTTVVICSHVLPEIEETCGRVGFMRRGKLVHIEDLSRLTQRHRIVGLLKGELPTLPDELKRESEITRHGDQVRIETSGDLLPMMNWLSNHCVTDVSVRPVGLRSIYDRCHSGTEGGIETGQTA